MISVTTEFQFLHAPGSRVLVVKANGGSVQLQVSAGATWITSDTYAVDTAVEVFLGGARVRVVPAGGAEYDLL